MATKIGPFCYGFFMIFRVMNSLMHRFDWQNTCHKNISMKILNWFITPINPIYIQIFLLVGNKNDQILEQKHRWCFESVWVNLLYCPISTYTNWFACPGFMLLTRKPWSFGNEWHTNYYASLDYYSSLNCLKSIQIFQRIKQPRSLVAWEASLPVYCCTSQILSSTWPNLSSLTVAFVCWEV